VKHKACFLKEVVEFLNVESGGNFIDATCGTGSHSEEIWKNLKGKGELLLMDIDDLSIKEVAHKFHDRGVYIVKGNYAKMDKFVKRIGWNKVSGILFDFGIGLHQIEDRTRGFSFKYDSPLDMRYSKQNPVRAEDVINTFKEEEIERILREFGEERFSRKIAKEIVKSRPIRRTSELVDLILRVKRRKGKIHPATKVFQALRIFVNRELENVKEGIRVAFDILKKAGRIVTVTYHSLEDRIVKDYFKGLEKEKRAVLITKKIKPSISEIQRNKNCRSAKLRVIEKL